MTTIATFDGRLLEASEAPGPALEVLRLKSGIHEDHWQASINGTRTPTRRELEALAPKDATRRDALKHKMAKTSGLISQHCHASGEAKR